MADASPGWGELLALVRDREGAGPLPEPDRQAALDLATSLGLASVPGAVGCSISEQGVDGSYRTPAAAGQISMILDEVQYAGDDGPCLRAARTGQPVRLASMATDQRWPELARRAAEHGVTSSLSLPLTTARRPAALNLYGSAGADFGADRAGAVARLVARAVATLLVDGGEPPIEGLNAAQLRRAIAERTLIIRAQGALMARDGSSARQAYHRLAVRSAEEASPLREVARRVLDEVGLDEATEIESEAGSSASGEDVSA